MEANRFLSDYYGNYDEDGRLLRKHGQVEYLTTMRYIEKFLPEKRIGKILEIGAGTGRYSLTLAKMGYDVTAIEYVEHNLSILKQKIGPDERICAYQGDARELASIKDQSFDLTLVLGPMYHLYTVEDQKKAIKEALRVTKSNGIVFFAYCISDPSIISHGFVDGHIHELIEKGMLDTDKFIARSKPEDIFVLYRKEDIDSLMSEMPAKRLHYVATDLFTNYMRPTIDEMDEATFQMYLQYHFFLCERPDFAGISHHTLDVVMKT